MKNDYLTLLTCLCLLLFTACGNPSEKPQETTTTSPSAVQESGNPSIDGLTKKIEQTPNSASLYATRGAIWYENENFDEAIADLERAISIDSLQPDFYHVLADVYMDYYRSRLALNTMERAGTAFPDRIPTLLKLSEFQYILQLYNESLFTLERIRNIDPQNAEMFFMFGNVFKEMGRESEAQSAYQSAVENDPELIDAWVKLGQMLAENNAPQAERYFENALRIDSNNIDALHAKAYFLSNHKDNLDGAIALYKKINTLDLQYVDGYYNLGLLYLDADSISAAYDSFDRAIKFDPQFTSAYFHRGLAAEMQGNTTQAIADYENVINLDPDFAGAQAGLRRLQK